MIGSLTIGDIAIDCSNAARLREFYAGLTGFGRTAAFDCPALTAENGLTILFMEPDLPHVPPVWPEEPGRQQKQLHLDFTVDDVPAAVAAAIGLGAAKAAAQYGGEHFVTMLDPVGHPFCLCGR